jgi:HEAT repeat protein
MSKLELTKIASDFAYGSDKIAEGTARDLARLASGDLEVFKQLLKDQRSDVRWWAVRSLAEIESPEITPLLITSLNDADVSVRQCAALALQKHPDQKAIPALIGMLKSTDQLLSRLAGDALIASGADAVPALLEVMQEDHPTARIQAARALALIGDTRAIPELFNALDGDSALLEYWAGEGLEKMGVGMVFFTP